MREFKSFESAYDWVRECNAPEVLIVNGEKWKLFPSGAAKPISDKAIISDLRETQSELIEALDLLLSCSQPAPNHGGPTSSFCEYCEVHADKEMSPDGQRLLSMGDLNHKIECARGIAESAIKAAGVQ